MSVSWERRVNRGWPDVALWLGIWMPFVVVVALRAHIGWFPVQDQAVLDLRLRGLLHGHDIPLVGAFSRFGWSHPGPIWFYVLAPFRAVAGTDGVLAGSILLFGAGVATLPVVVRRRYGVSVATVAVLASIPALMAAGSFAILLPWNPNLAFAWLPVFLVLALASIDRSRDDLGPALFLGAMLVQLHVAYAPLVVLTLVFAVIVIVHRDGASEIRDRARASRRWLIAAGLLYLPPLLEQIAHGWHGNAGKIAKFFVAPPHGLGSPTGIGFAAGTLAGVLRWPLTGLGGSGEATDPFTGYLIPDPAWAVAPIIVAIVVIYLFARRSRARELGDAVLFAGVVLCVSLASLSRVVGERWIYLFMWRFAVMWFVVAVAIVGAVQLWRQSRTTGVVHDRARTNLLRSCGLAAAVVLFGFAVVSKSITAPYGHLLRFERSTERLANEILATSKPDGAVQIVRFDGQIEGVADGVLNKLDERGWHVGVSPELAYKYGDSHVVSEHSAREIWFVTETNLGTTLAAAVPNARVVAAITPLSKSEDHELARLQRALVARIRVTGHFELLPAVGYELAALAVAGRLDTVGIDMARLTELNAKVAHSGGCRCAVTIVPPGTPSDPGALASQLPASVVESWR